MPIRTVSGLLEPEEVTGPVLAHEHLTLDLTTTDDPSAVVSDGNAVTEELARAKDEHGLALVVDLTCRGMGGDPAAVRHIAERAGVEVVVATGWYYERFHPQGEPGDSVEDAVELLVRDIRDGVGESGIRPGVLGEIGSHGFASPAERTSLVASARAAAQTGLSLATHAHLGRGALEQLELLTAQGLEPHRISIGHQDLSDDGAQHRRIAETGAYIAFDTVGKTSYQADERRVAMLLDLVEAGYARHILLSNDISRDSYLTVNGGQGFGHVLGPFRTALDRHGIDDATADLLYRANALRWLNGTEKP
ncbi:phosphotriesterase [Aeromicrobium phragmitis]|uniref:Phosphotriesterase n=1 Tax=Aeromicrobium phragmitis TaxID=2478914 RepID=A0A3L8PQA7_9ACTN|nr:phosphotriesterase [Aeromicrobium phragmitis]RLV57019.1 phosphotriesterase [Aeromicrobium phragmitis]